MTGPLRILMVEDSAADRALWRRYLSTAYECAEEEFGESGLRRCEEFSPDCVILDLHLPDLNGLDFLGRLRDKGHTCAVVVATAYGSEQIAVRALQAGATDYLVKGSITPEGFRRAIENAIEKRRLVRQVEQHRRELEASELRFRTLTDAIPQIVWTASAPGSLDYVNRGWQEFTGAGAAEARGDGWVAWLHPDDRARVTETWREAAATARTFEVECRLKSAAGTYRCQLMRGVPFEVRPEGSATGLGTLTDIEDQKRIEQQMYQRQKLESIGLLAGGVAHDFNNLLVSILGGVSLAIDMLGAHPARPLLTGAVQASERAAHLTRQMLAYAGKGAFVVEDIDLSELAVATCELVRVSIPKTIQLTIDTGREIPTVQSDSSQLQQVIMNLVINASEAIGDQTPGVIAVRTGVEEIDSVFRGATGEIPPGRYAVLEVADTGCGMDEETRTKIFEPFYTTKFTGRGLGLAAVQGIVHGIRGAIEVISSPGAGTTFRILLPASAADVKAPAQVAGDAGRRRASGRVLVVDDEELVRDMARSILRKAGYTVWVVASGRDAIRLVEHGKKPSVILLDMSMPAMSGEETLSRLRAAGVKCPVVVSSGYSENEVSRRFRGEQVSAFLSKPYTPQTLLETFTSVLTESPLASDREEPAR